MILLYFLPFLRLASCMSTCTVSSLHTTFWYGEHRRDSWDRADTVGSWAPCSATYLLHWYHCLVERKTGMASLHKLITVNARWSNESMHWKAFISGDISSIRSGSQVRLSNLDSRDHPKWFLMVGFQAIQCCNQSWGNCQIAGTSVERSKGTCISVADMLIVFGHHSFGACP